MLTDFFFVLFFLLFFPLLFSTMTASHIVIPETMKAMILDASGPSRMSWVSTLKVPRVGKNDVLVKVVGSSVNTLDVKQAETYSNLLSLGRTKVVGRDVAGTVVSVGKNVLDFGPGDQIFGWGHGFAEYAICHPREIARVPETLQPIDFAHVTCAGVTANQILRKHWLDVPYATVRSILVIGASGGVGSCVVQIARVVGGPELRITGVCSNKNGDYIRNIGANDSIDYQAANFDLARALPIHSIDLIVDVVSGSAKNAPNYVQAGQLLLKPTGKYVVTNSLSGMDRLRANLSHFTGWNVQKPQFDLHTTKAKKSSEKDLFVLARLVEQGKFKLHVSEEIPLLEVPIRRALHAMKQRHVRGKIRIVTENYAERGFSSPVQSIR